MAGAKTQIDRSVLYTIGEFVEVIAPFPPAPQFFKNTLFNQVETWWGQQAAVDFYRGSAMASPFISPYKRGYAVPRDKFKTSFVDIPDIKLTRDIRAFDARYRMPGEALGSKMSSQDRIMQLQNQDYIEMDLAISRREEVMCSSVLFSGSLVIVDGDDNEPINQIDFGPLNSTILDPLTFWDQAGSDPLSDLQILKRLVTSSGYPANLFVLGTDAASAFLKNQAVKDSSNFLNFRLGTVDVQQFQDFANFGVNLIGTFFGMPIYSYEGVYSDPIDGKTKYFMPVDACLVASTAISHRFAYGMVTQVEDVETKEGAAQALADYQLPRVPQYVADSLTDQLLFRLWARPLPIPVDVKSWSTAKVCTAVSVP